MSSEREEPRGCTALISDGVHLFRCSIGTSYCCDRHQTADGDA